jgi:hypothetical protein
MAATVTSLDALSSLLRDGENVISPYVRDSDEEPALGALAASGPRAREATAEYTLLVEAIREGYLLHYETPRLIEGADGDLRLLAGDYLYALGLERLAARGDLDAVRELADLISLVAQVHAENGDGSAGTERVAPRSSLKRVAPVGAPSHDTLASTGALWLAATVAVGAGAAPGHQRAKEAVRRDAPDAADLLIASAAETARREGMGDALARAAEAIGFAAEDVRNRG